MKLTTLAPMSRPGRSGLLARYGPVPERFGACGVIRVGRHGGIGRLVTVGVGISFKPHRIDALRVSSCSTASSAITFGINCIGLTGVWNWQRPRKRDDSGRGYGSRYLIDDLNAINWANRDVIIAFDSDAAEKHSVELAQQKLAEALAKRGAKVKVARLPSGENGRKLGLDDALVELGKMAVDDVLKAAGEPELPELSWPDLARMFVELRFSIGDEPTVRYWRHTFWQWTSHHYEEVDDRSLEVEAYQFLEQIGWMPNRNAVSEVIAALRAEVAIDSHTEPPCCLRPGNLRLPGTPLVFANGVAFLNFDESLMTSPLPTTIAHPAWFCTGSRSFPYEPFTACPTWDALLESSLPDPVARDLLQQWCGYLLSGRLDRHKILVLHGAKRAGKSIIANIMAQLVGQAATATSTLKELGNDFGLSPLVGKQLLLIPDAHDRGDCLGAVERLKAISGCDRLDVNRKHKAILTSVQLQTRVVITCNQLPRFLDPSGALHQRLLVVHFPISHAGHEDRSLPDQIRAELPGIFNWAYEGWLSLNCGDFAKPPSSTDILDRAEHILSPIKAFVDECCVMGATVQVTTNELWDAWQKWCKNTGHHPGNREKLGNDLAAALPDVERKQLRCNNSRSYFYVGLSLNDCGKTLQQQWHLAAHRRI
jgi:putative DNA primase/helicase